MASTTMRRAATLPTTSVTINGVTYDPCVKDFAVFIDTHRDQPHVGSFEADIHRGQCKPTVVHLQEGPSAGDWYLIRASDGKMLVLHDKHKFVTLDWWRQFLFDWMSEKGEVPLDGDGMMPTTHLRDARSKRYFLKSFRQAIAAYMGR